MPRNPKDGTAPGEAGGERTGPATRELDSSAMRTRNVLAIAISAISPTTSVFLVYGAGLSAAGTGVVWAFAIGGVIALSMALCYAECGSVFPSAGGAYTIVRRALGPVWGGVSAVLFLVLGLVTTAAILVSSATYLSSLVPGGLPVGLVALGMMALVTALSVGRIAPASWVAGGMLVLELSVVLVFTGFAFAHLSPHNAPFTAPSVAHGPGGALVPVGAAGMFAAVVPALFAFNGYDWPLYFAEETRATRRALPRAVVVAAVVAVAVELAAVAAATYAVRDLGAATAASSPLSLIAHQVMGPTGATILLVGVVVAMFDTGLAGNLGFARVFYAAARDGMLPAPVARLFGHVSPRTKVPTYSIAFLLVGNGVLCVLSSLNDLITFTSVAIVTVYLLVAVSALVSRVRDRGFARAFRMPLWPLPPVIAIAGVVVALTQQAPEDLVIAFGIALVSLLGYTVFRTRLPARLAGVTATAPPAPKDPDPSKGTPATP